MKNFSIARTLLEPLQDHVRDHGRRDDEAGGFLLGTYEDPVATVLALAEGVGVERSRGFFRVSGTAMEQLFTFAENENLRVWAQVHSHPRRSFLSETDETDGFRVEGFISGVIPNYVKPPRKPQSWGWWTFHHGAWEATGIPSLNGGVSRVVTFDATGIR